MEYQSILLVLLALVSFDFISNKILGWLNNKSSKQTIPQELTGIYDNEKYATSQAYQSEVFNYGLLGSIVSFLSMVLILAFGGFGFLDEWIRGWGYMEPVTSLIFFGILFIGSDLLGIPFDLYGTFVIEEKYGFNKMTWQTYVMDKIKGWLLTIIIGGLIMSAFLYLILIFEASFWIYFWIVISILMIFINMFYTSLIIPLFNKLEPLEEGDLKVAIMEYSKKVDFPLTNVFVIDGSKRSSKGNAFFSGFGKNKKIVLYDTLIENHSNEELVGILAHEVGHFKKKHIITSMLIGIVQTGLMLWVLSLLLFNNEISWAMGASQYGVHLNVLAFGILYSPISTILGVLMNLLSRKNEYEADAYAVTTYAKAPLITALKKLTADNLSNLTPHPWYEFMNYSHPSLLKRIQAMNKVKG